MSGIRILQGRERRQTSKSLSLLQLVCLGSSDFQGLAEFVFIFNRCKQFIRGSDSRYLCIYSSSLDKVGEATQQVCLKEIVDTSKDT